MSDSLNSPGIVNAINQQSELSDRDEYADAKAGPWERAAAWLLLIGLSWGAVYFVALVVREIGAALVRGLS